MSEKQPEYMDKLLALVNRARSDTGFQEEMKSGDEHRMRAALKEVGLTEPLLNELIDDLKLIISPQPALFWRFIA